MSARHARFAGEPPLSIKVNVLVPPSPTQAKNIKKVRKEKGISQDKILKLAEVAYNTIIKIESGTIKNPAIETVQKIAKALDILYISLDELTIKYANYNN